MSSGAVPTAERVFQAPLTIGVISDTHIYAGGRRQLPVEVCDLLARFSCGLIVHAGDSNSVAVLQSLAEIAPVLAVTGNNDDREMLKIAPPDLTFSAGKTRVGLLHGHGGTSARSEARLRFGGRADLVIYGHSHIPMIERIEGVTYFNPGSPTDRRWHEHFGIGLIHFRESGFRPELILFKQPAELASIVSD